MKIHSVALMEDTATGHFAIEARKGDRPMFGYRDKSKDRLLTFFELEHGQVDWQR